MLTVWRLLTARFAKSAFPGEGARLYSTWVARSPKVLIVAESMRGIDIAAKADVHQLLQEPAARGMAVIVVSSAVPEVLAISDRVTVVREGAIAAERSRHRATRRAIMAAAAAGTFSISYTRSFQ
jgi:ABC-type sugar transport system ATPase subunit